MVFLEFVCHFVTPQLVVGFMLTHHLEGLLALCLVPCNHLLELNILWLPNVSRLLCCRFRALGTRNMQLPMRSPLEMAMPYRTARGLCKLLCDFNMGIWNSYRESNG